MDGNETNNKRLDDSNTTPSLRKKSNLIIRGTSLIFDEIRVAKDEENQMRSLDELEEECGDGSSR